MVPAEAGCPLLMLPCGELQGVSYLWLYIRVTWELLKPLKPRLHHKPNQFNQKTQMWGPDSNDFQGSPGDSSVYLWLRLSYTPSLSPAGHTLPFGVSVARRKHLNLCGPP